MGVVPAVKKLLSKYHSDTPQSLKLIDAYLVYILFTGIFQFVYCAIVGTYPYNAFLAGFISTVSSFVLAANLRIQTNQKNNDFPSISNERAFADFVVGNLVVHLIVANFLG
ncbi:Dolichyl-diphosphooligosaccharide-protein glycosyltransferase subunit dad1 [Basidiobolus ranarum]|uniref:Dolichyl-diphosphooligosaccharide--protein glycosyltransferase subunit OST2 n=1 Tax=Basidiobolus ranarum TaxID=34480 RepID=A0ABR2WB39_9FUNG